MWPSIQRALLNIFNSRVIIVGCCFHLLQAIHKWLNKKGDESLKDIDLRQDLDEEIKKLILTHEFDKKQKEFINTYSQIAPKFTNYFTRTYLSETALFPPTIWARSKIPLNYDIAIDLTNNHSESWNRQDVVRTDTTNQESIFDSYTVKQLKLLLEQVKLPSTQPQTESQSQIPIQSQSQVLIQTQSQSQIPIQSQSQVLIQSQSQSQSQIPIQSQSQSQIPIQSQSQIPIQSQSPYYYSIIPPPQVHVPQTQLLLTPRSQIPQQQVIQQQVTQQQVTQQIPQQQIPQQHILPLQQIPHNNHN